MNPIIITRPEAKAQGLKHFFTGAPCRRGHVSERIVSNTSCVSCIAVLAATPAHKALEATRNATPRRKSARRIYSATPEARALDAARKATPEYMATDAAKSAYLRAKKQGLLCSCCNPKDFLLIYREAALMGDHEVDHRIPRHLGGPHCVSNLQILTIAAHLEKSLLERQLRGTYLRGESSPVAKLTNSDVGHIFDLWAAGWTQKNIGSELGVSRSNVGEILRGKTWTHLPDADEYRERMEDGRLK